MFNIALEAGQSSQGTFELSIMALILNKEIIISMLWNDMQFKPNIGIQVNSYKDIL